LHQVFENYQYWYKAKSISIIINTMVPFGYSFHYVCSVVTPLPSQQRRLLQQRNLSTSLQPIITSSHVNESGIVKIQKGEQFNYEVELVNEVDEPEKKKKKSFAEKSLSDQDLH
jgi:hypothetical protein